MRALDRFSQAARALVEVTRPELSEEELELYAASIGGGVLGMIIHHLRAEDQRPAAELAREMVSAVPAWMYPSSS
ncbi:MAG TPA: hypothetical protein H9837_14260 [Candidatus Brachybacterium merdigallinarum]|nr:hypothetical protein [Candidatus Brachybacterium merdigallinarum]